MPIAGAFGDGTAGLVDGGAGVHIGAEAALIDGDVQGRGACPGGEEAIRATAVEEAVLDVGRDVR